MKHYIKILTFCLLLLSVVQASDAGKRKKMPKDTVGLDCRAVMESFSKVGEGLDQRLDYYSSRGFTHYFYSPSDDKYCNSWGWKFLYNDSDRHQIRSFVNICRSKGLEFVWTVNPGPDYAWDEADYDFLLNKLVMMYYNGIRSFAVYFSDPKDVAALRQRLMADFVLPKKGKVEIYLLNELPIVSYPSDSEPVRTLVNGYCFDDAFINSAEQNETVVCNLIENDDFSRFALTAASDFAKNPKSYSSERSLLNGVESLPPAASDAFLTFLKHLSDAHRAENPAGTDCLTLSDSDIADAAAEFEKISLVRGAISQCGDKTLMDALEPYLQEFDKFGSYGKSMIECLRFYRAGELENFWKTYVASIRSDADMEASRMYPVGEKRLHSLCSLVNETLVSSFFSHLSVTSLRLSTDDPLRRPADMDLDFTTFKPSYGHYEASIPVHANTCHLLTGRIPEGERVYFRQLGTDGRLVAEYILSSSYSTFPLKTGAVVVDIVGNVDIYETIFVHL